MRLTRFGIIAGLCLGIEMGCAHHVPKPELVIPAEPAQVATPARLELKGVAGRVETTQYRSSALTRTYENQQILKERFEDLDFVVQATQRTVDAEKGLLEQQITTIKKDGEGDLHAMAYPEVGERITIVLNKQGQVFHVSGFSPNSIFYVPAISLPAHTVSVGDTWPLTADWMSQENGVPLHLEMVTILKRFVKCGPQNCAELEVSGDVRLAVTPRNPMNFKSEIRGVMYLGVDSGALIWSQIRNSEFLLSDNHKVVIESCLESRLTEPAAEQHEFAVAQLKCSADDIKSVQPR
jgi:hypothetical protein